MNNILTIRNVRGYLDKKGTAHLNIEDVSRGLGFTQTKNETEYIRWERVNGYLGDMGFPQLVGKEFIPENVFYRLAMKGENESAIAFQNMIADEILPTIRKTGTYSVDTYHKKSTSVGEVTNLLKTLKSIMKEENHTPEAIANMAQVICDQFNIILPEGFVKKMPYEQLRLLINLEESG